MAHVDDFLISGRDADLNWIRSCLTEQFELKSSILGYSNGDLRSGGFLGRSIQLMDYGVEYKGDSKHTKTLLNEW